MTIEDDALLEVADWSAIRKAALVELRRQQLLTSFDGTSEEALAIARQLELTRRWADGVSPRGGRMIVIRSVEIGVDPEGVTADPGSVEHEVVLDVIAGDRTSAIRTIENGPHVVVVVVHRGITG
jgi:hypothetical protein